MVWSTAISDGALATVTLGGCAVLIGTGGRSKTLGGMGMGIVGVAAALGSARYGLLPSLEPVHVAMSRLGGLIGVPLIGVGFLASSLRKEEWRRNLGFAALIALPGLAAMLGGFPEYRVAIGAVAMLIVAIVSGRQFGKDKNAAVAGMVGAVLTGLAGLVIGTEGELFGFARIDWFHYVLAAANALLIASLLRLKP